MERRIWIATVIAATLMASLGCENTPPPEPKAEETKASMLKLEAKTPGTCPALKGTYVCTAGDKSENVSVWIKEHSAGVPHVVFGPENPDKMDFADFIVENFAMDNGGFIADGQIHDKAEQVRKGLVLLVQVASYTVAPTWLKSIGFDLKAELKRIDLSNFPVGYVSSCQDGKVALHYVAGDNAIKTKISKKDDTIMATTFAIENGGPVVKHIDTCKFVSDEVRLHKPATETIDDLGKSVTDKVVKAWNYPGTINFEVEGSLDLVGKEFITMKFDRSGYFTSRHIYNFDKAFLGPTDDFWFDDVTVKVPWNKIVVNMDNMIVYGGNPNDGGEQVGTVIADGQNFKLRFDFNKWALKYKSRTLEIGPISFNLKEQ